MEIAGEWKKFDDGITRPVVRVNVLGSHGWHRDFFLIDTGADCTVLAASFFDSLQILGGAFSSEQKLVGVGGQSDSVIFNTTLEFTTTTGTTARVTGHYSAFLDPRSMDLNVLGRDVLANFDLLLSRRCMDVRLLSGNHRYDVIAT